MINSEWTPLYYNVHWTSLVYSFSASKEEISDSKGMGKTLLLRKLPLQMCTVQLLIKKRLKISRVDSFNRDITMKHPQLIACIKKYSLNMQKKASNVTFSESKWNLLISNSQRSEIKHLNVHFFYVFVPIVWKKTCYGCKLAQTLKNWLVPVVSHHQWNTTDSAICMHGCTHFLN